MDKKEREELLEALGTLLDLIQLGRLLDKIELSPEDMQDFVWAKNVHSKYASKSEAQG